MMLSWLQRHLEQFTFNTLHQRSLPVIVRWQDAAVKRILLHAATNVPFWRDVLIERSIDPITLCRVNDLRLLPVMRKEDYRQRAQEEYIDHSQPVMPLWRSTSGSTGKPFTFLVGNKTLDSRYDDFARLRFLHWKGVIPRNLSSVKVARIKMSPEYRENRIFISVAAYREDPRAAITTLHNFKPEVLESYGTVLLDLAECSSQTDTPLRIPYVTSYGEMLTPAARAVISKAFHAEVYDRYGIEEIGVLAMECEKHDGQHIYGESIVMEVVDVDGRPLPRGTHGRIVVTDLLNYNMPFIRYDTGDQGVMSDEPCLCGLHMPRVWFDGRYSASLSFSKGNIHHLEFDGALNTFMHAIVQYQVAKKDTNLIEIRIVPAPGFNAAMKKRLQESLRELVGVEIDLNIKLVSALAQLPRGKSQTLIDECLPRSQTK